jgi:tetratricopeptide (TPR) repeat protein
MFIGRERERGEVAASKARIVTLWGPPGVGKTALARQCAPGALFVDLARTDLATALGVEPDVVVHAVTARGVRIVADHATPAHAPVLASLPNVLVTSRAALGVPGECAIEIAPLSAEQALALYTHISGAADEAIVAKLDGLPLAIELAAARRSLLGAAELLARLDRKLDLLKPLRAAIASSWDLLDDDARTVLRACAEFEAPFDLGLVEMTVGKDVLDGLESLHKSALLIAESGSLRLLEVVRDFSREERPPPSGYAEAVLRRVRPLAEAAARGEAIDPELSLRRADLRRIAERAEPALEGSPEACAELALAGDSAESAFALLLSRANALRAAGHLDEAEAMLRAIVERETADPHVLRVAGTIARSRGDTARAISLLGAALDHTTDDAYAGIVLGELGVAEKSVDRLAAAIARLARTKSIRAEARYRSHLAVLTHRSGDPRAAIPLHESALELHRKVGDRRLEGAELSHLGFVWSEIADAARAKTTLEEARRTLAEAGARGLEAFALVLQARLAVDVCDHLAARLALAAALEVSPPGWKRLEATHRLVAGHLAMATGDRAAAATAYAGAVSGVEVGFEALTPAYLAFARGEAPPAITAPTAPLNSALAILTGAATTAPPEHIASSSEVRRALAFAGRRALIVTATGLVLPDGRAIDLAKKKNARLIIAALAKARRDRPGEALTPDTLIAAGWPNEKMRGDAATKRLHTAIWTLRKLGLDGILHSSEAGYWLTDEIAMDSRL